MVSKYRELFNKSADASLIIRNGVFEDCNQATVDMLGFKTKAQVLHTHPSELSPEFQPDGQDSVGKADKMMALAYQKGSHRFEWDHLRANGDVFPVEVLLTAISQEKDNETLYVVWRDITEIKEHQRFQEATNELANKLSTFMDMEEIARAGAKQIRSFFDSDAISINYIDHINGINRGLYTEDTLEGETTPTTFKPLSTSFAKLDPDTIKGTLKPHLVNRTPAEMKTKSMNRPFGEVARRSASLMFASIVWDNVQVGEVTAQSYTFNKYSAKSLSQLQTLATQIGGALVRARTAEDLKIEHKELRKNQAQLLISQRLARVGSWDFDAVSKTMTWSPELYQIFGMDPREQITLRHVLSMIHPEDVERYKREIKSKTLVRTDYRIVRADGSLRWLHEEIDEPQLKKGKPVFFRGCSQDITSSKEAEKRLAESDGLRELLLDIITHDLRNPAGVILGAAELAVEKMPDNQLLEVIHSTSKRLINVLDETSLLTQATFGEAIPLEQLDLNKLLSEVAEEFTARLDQASMTLEMDLPRKLFIQANPLISEVFKNYISNAIKYARAGQRILIRAHRDEAAVSVSVSDFGDTIQERYRESIFERHTQLSGKHQKGRGLGLAIVKRIATAHAAQVWVEPNLPQGNRFFIRIPVPTNTTQ
ncbi:MAG: PAS domain S-box protein [Candidatus Marinimicrobia bacterium]|nr:PAS domain S-box protein [Candidatus Neomarinimicrobiota bacterium]